LATNVGPLAEVVGVPQFLSDEGSEHKIMPDSEHAWRPPVKREEFLKAVAHGSAAAWEHVNILREYDLSEEKFWNICSIELSFLKAGE
jgi:hypothetical protein